MGCTVPRCWVDQAAWVPGGSHHARVASPELGSRVGCGSPRKSSRQAGQARLGQVRPRMLVSHRILKKGKQGKQALPVLRPPFPPPFPNCFSFRAGPFASRILHLLTSRILHLLTAPPTKPPRFRFLPSPLITSSPGCQVLPPSAATAVRATSCFSALGAQPLGPLAAPTGDKAHPEALSPEEEAEQMGSRTLPWGEGGSETLLPWRGKFC